MCVRAALRAAIGSRARIAASTGAGCEPDHPTLQEFCDEAAIAAALRKVADELDV